MNQETFKLFVNENHEFDFPADTARTLDAVVERENKFHILHQGKAYHVELLETDLHNQTYLLKVNGARYTVKIDDALDQLVKQLGLNVQSSQKINSVKAPMPGLVLSIDIEPGQTVQKGDPLLILEAMKMENVIKSAGEGTIKAISVKQGEAVEKGQLLIEME